MALVLALAALLALLAAPADAAKRRPAPRPASVKVALPSTGDLTIARVTVQLTALGKRLSAPSTITPKLANGRRLPGGIGALARVRRISRTKRTAKYHVFVTIPRPVPASARSAATDRFVALTFPPGRKRKTLVRSYVEAQDSYAEGGVPDEDICLAYESLPPAGQAKTRTLVRLALGSPPEPAARLFDDAFVASCPDLAPTLGALSPGFVSALTGGLGQTGSGGGETRSVVMRSIWASTPACPPGQATTGSITVTNPAPGQSVEYTFSPIYPPCTSPPYENAVLDATTNQILDLLVFPPNTTYRLLEESCASIGDPPECVKVRLRLVLTNGGAG